MGFSLEMFFEELLAMLDDDALSGRKQIENFVKREQQYAKDCGIIKTEEK
jgi:hypothetical protein